MRRIIAVGKDEATVHCIGSPAADTLSGFVPMPKDELERQIGFVLGDRYVVATFHPATLEHVAMRNGRPKLFSMRWIPFLRM